MEPCESGQRSRRTFWSLHMGNGTSPNRVRIWWLILAAPKMARQPVWTLADAVQRYGARPIALAMRRPQAVRSSAGSDAEERNRLQMQAWQGAVRPVEDGDRGWIETFITGAW